MKKRENIIPYHPYPAKHVLLTIEAARVSVCLSLLRKKKRKSYLFIYWKHPICSFYFQVEIRLLLISRRPFFSMFVFKVWKYIDTASRRRRSYLFLTSCPVFQEIVLLTTWPDLRLKLKSITDIWSPSTHDNKKKDYYNLILTLIQIKFGQMICSAKNNYFQVYSSKLCTFYSKWKQRINFSR